MAQSYVIEGEDKGKERTLYLLEDNEGLFIEYNSMAKMHKKIYLSSMIDGVRLILSKHHGKNMLPTTQNTAKKLKSFRLILQIQQPFVEKKQKWRYKPQKCWKRKYQQTKKQENKLRKSDTKIKPGMKQIIKKKEIFRLKEKEKKKQREQKEELRLQALLVDVQEEQGSVQSRISLVTQKIFSGLKEELLKQYNNEIIPSVTFFNHHQIINKRTGKTQSITDTPFFLSKDETSASLMEGDLNVMSYQAKPAPALLIKSTIKRWHQTIKTELKGETHIMAGAARSRHA